MRTTGGACPSCGADTGDDPGTAEDRIEASRELQHALAALETLRWIYVVIAVLAGLVLGSLLVAMGFPRDAFGLPLYGTLAGVLLASAGAAWDVARHPRAWALATALPVTALFLLAFATSGGRISVGVILTGLSAGGLWYGAYLLFRMGRILQAHPDLRLARILRGGDPEAAEGAVAGKLRRRSEEETARARRRMLVFGGGALAGALLLGFGIHAWLHPGPRAALDGFRDSWNAARWTAVGERFEPGVRERMTRSMETLLRRRGWQEKPPRLVQPAVEEAGEDAIRAVFTVPEGEIRTHWRLREGTWVLTGMEFPER